MHFVTISVNFHDLNRDLIQLQWPSCDSLIELYCLCFDFEKCWPTLPTYYCQYFWFPYKTGVVFIVTHVYICHGGKARCPLVLLLYSSCRSRRAKAVLSSSSGLCMSQRASTSRKSHPVCMGLTTSCVPPGGAWEGDLHILSWPGTRTGPT